MTSLTDPSTPNVFVNEYQVTRFPRDHGGARHFSLWVQYQESTLWSLGGWEDTPKVSRPKEITE